MSYLILFSIIVFILVPLLMLKKPSKKVLEKIQRNSKVLQSPQAKQVSKSSDIKQIAKSSEIQQIKKSPEFQQAQKSVEIQQASVTNNIFEISKELLKELNIFASRKTKIKFVLFKENKIIEKHIYLVCDWLPEKIQINYGKNNNVIEIDYKDKDNSYNSESNHMIKLLYEKKEITFNIHILLHQINIFTLIPFLI